MQAGWVQACCEEGAEERRKGKWWTATICTRGLCWRRTDRLCTDNVAVCHYRSSELPRDVLLRARGMDVAFYDGAPATATTPAILSVWEQRLLHQWTLQTRFISSYIKPSVCKSSSSKAHADRCYRQPSLALMFSFNSTFCLSYIMLPATYRDFPGKRRTVVWKAIKFVTLGQRHSFCSYNGFYTRHQFI